MKLKHLGSNINHQTPVGRTLQYPPSKQWWRVDSLYPRHDEVMKRYWRLIQLLINHFKIKKYEAIDIVLQNMTNGVFATNSPRIALFGGVGFMIRKAFNSRHGSKSKVVPYES